MKATMESSTLASITLVLATSRGVVRAAATPPRKKQPMDTGY